MLSIGSNTAALPSCTSRIHRLIVLGRASSFTLSIFARVDCVKHGADGSAKTVDDNPIKAIIPPLRSAVLTAARKEIAPTWRIIGRHHLRMSQVSTARIDAPCHRLSSADCSETQVAPPHYRWCSTTVPALSFPPTHVFR